METTSKGTVGVGVVQFHATPGDRAGNLAIAEAQLRAMAGDGLDIAVLPELFGSGYDMAADLDLAAEDQDGPTVTELTRIAGDLDIVLATTVLCRTDRGALVNRAVVLSGSGVLASADKARLWGAERGTFAPGDGGLAVARTPLATIGVAVCYEAGFPESARALARQGVDIIAMPSAFGRQRMHAWDLQTRSRALENGCFVAAAGMCGENATGTQFAGTSRIVDPRGTVLLELGAEADCGVRAIDLAAIEQARTEIPYLADLGIDLAPAGSGSIR